MTDTERLQEIKERMSKAIIYFGRRTGRSLFIEDVIWLLEQVEQIEELKKQSRTLNKKNARLLKVNSELAAERDDLRKRYESDKQYYINVQKGHANKRRKKRG